MASGVSRLFDVRAEERRPATLAFLALLGITAAHTLIETARDALFLTKVPITYLPALYLAIAAAGLLTTRIGAAIEARRDSTSKSRLDPVVASEPEGTTVSAASSGAVAPPRPSASSSPRSSRCGSCSRAASSRITHARLLEEAPALRTKAGELMQKLLRGKEDVADGERLLRIGKERTEENYGALLGAMIDQGGEVGVLAAYHASELGLRDSVRGTARELDASKTAFGSELSAPERAGPVQTAEVLA